MICMLGEMKEEPSLIGFDRTREFFTDQEDATSEPDSLGAEVDHFRDPGPIRTSICQAPWVGSEDPNTDERQEAGRTGTTSG